MATDVDQAYEAWSQEQLSDGDESHETSVSQMLDHGSISFGRFPIESLSWERRSVFTHNRCQEELEKFNGLVAKKKAYFEERYKRIREMKAQQNQQTELTLEYSGEGSISSQSGEEDGAASQHESTRDRAANIVHSASEEAKPGATFGHEINCNEPLQERCMEPESTLPNLTSSRGILEKTEPDQNSIDAELMQPLATESSLPLSGDVEEIESNCSGNFDNKEILQKHKNLMSNLEPGRGIHGTSLDNTKTKLHQTQSIRKSYVKSPAAARNDPNVKRETKLNVVRSSKGLKTPSQKMVSQTLSKTTANRVKSNGRPILVASNGQLPEARSNVTTPGPFTLVMERRAISRGNAAKLDSGGSIKPASSLSHAKVGSSVQDKLKKMAAISKMTSRRGPEIKRDLKEERNKPLVVGCRYPSSKKIEAHVVGPPKSRSINLPARNKSTSNGGTETQIATAKGAKQKEGNIETREAERVTRRATRPSTSDNTRIGNRKGNIGMSELQRVTTRTTRPSTSDNTRMGAKKPLSAQEAYISSRGRKPQHDNLSLDGRKTRRSETPHWR